MLVYGYGQGTIILLTDLWFIENDDIGHYDHAQFLWRLIHFNRTPEHLWIMRLIEKRETPPLWKLLWHNVPAPLISIAVLLLFWLGYASQRFGPMLPMPQQTRRRLLEHIEASGNFLWNQRKVMLLLRYTQQALLKDLYSVHPEWTSLSQEALSQKIAQTYDLPLNEVRSAIYYTNNESKIYTEVVFTQIIRTLSQIKAKL
jgi:hypothetical protein